MTNLESHSCIGLAAIQSLTSLIQVQLERVFLIALEDRIFHDLPHHILQFTHPAIQILVPICRSLTHIESLYATIFDSFFHSPVQIRINLLGIKRWVTNYCYDFLSCFTVLYDDIIQDIYGNIRQSRIKQESAARLYM